MYLYTEYGMKDFRSSSVQFLNLMFLESFGFDPFGIKPEQVGIKVLENWAEAGGVLGNIVSRITDSAFTFFSATGNFFLSLIVAFYFMIDFDAIVGKVHSVIPRRYEATRAML